MLRIFSKLSPEDLLAASQVCRSWRQFAGLTWRHTKEASVVAADATGSAGDGPLVVHRARQLERLSLLVDTRLADEGLRLLAQQRPAALRHLSIRARGAGRLEFTHGALEHLVSHCPRLETLLLEAGHLAVLSLRSDSLRSLRVLGAVRLQHLWLQAPQLERLSLELGPRQPTPARDTFVTRFLANVSGPTAQATQVCTVLREVAEARAPLRHVHVSSPHLTDRAVEALVSCDPSGWQSLCLNHSAQVTTDGVRQVAARCRGLELLDLSGCTTVTDEALGPLADGLGKSLLRLHLACCPLLSRTAIRKLVGGLPLLRVLDLGFSLVDRPRGSTAAEKNTAMDRMLGTGNMLVSPTLERSQPSRRCRSLLEELDPSAVGASQTLELRSPSLECLSLWGCSRIRALRLECPRLEQLDLTNCRQLEAGGTEVACPNLKSLQAAGAGAGVAHRVWECVESLQQELRQEAGGAADAVHEPPRSRRRLDIDRAQPAA